MKTRILASALILFVFGSTCGSFEVLVFQGTPAGDPVRWQTGLVPYSVHTGGTAGVSSNAVVKQYKKVIAVINKSAQSVSSTTDPRAQLANLFSFGGKTSSVVFGDGKNGVIFDKNFSISSFVLAIQRLRGSAVTTISEGDLIFNDKEYDWTKGATNIAGKKFNVFTVMLHEMGHGAGLGHTAVKDAVMYFQFQKDVKTFHPDDSAGTKFIYQGQSAGSLPTLITPIDQSTHSFSSLGQAANALTFRWKGSAAAATYTVVFAADSAFTKNVLRMKAPGEALYLKGKKLNKVKKIQNASATQQIFWRVEETGASVKKSDTFTFQVD